MKKNEEIIKKLIDELHTIEIDMIALLTRFTDLSFKIGNLEEGLKSENPAINLYRKLNGASVFFTKIYIESHKTFNEECKDFLKLMEKK